MTWHDNCALDMHAVHYAPIAPDTAPAANSTSGRGSTASAASGRDTSSLPGCGRPSLASTAASSKLAMGAALARRIRTGRRGMPAALQLTLAALPPSLRWSGSTSSDEQLQHVAGGALFRRRPNSTLIVGVVCILLQALRELSHIFCSTIVWMRSLCYKAS